MHINNLELLAVKYTLVHLHKYNNNIRHVRVMIDNTTAVAYINHMGGTKSIPCNYIATDLWKWCANRSLWISAAHIAGHSNFIADLNSRTFHEATEWSLHTNVFRDICIQYGLPDVDIMASALNHQVEHYVAWQPDDSALAIDAFSICWSEFNLIYCFPPFSMIGKCPAKMQQDKAEAILVIPCWNTQTWFPQALRMLVHTPLLYPPHPNMLTSPSNQATHPLANKLSLIAVRVSGKHSHTQEFLMQQKIYCLPPGDQTQSINMSLFSENGSHFVIKNRLISIHKRLITF